MSVSIFDQSYQNIDLFGCLQRESRGWDYWKRKRQDVQGAKKPPPQEKKEPKTQKMFQGKHLPSRANFPYKYHLQTISIIHTYFNQLHKA